MVDLEDGRLEPETTASAVADFEMVHAQPMPALSGIVIRLTGYRESRGVAIRQREPASLVVPLIISFGDPFAIALGRTPTDEDSFGSFAAGLFAGPVMIDSTGAAFCLQIDFSPLGARRFFGMPLSRLADRMVPLDDVLGARGVALRERLGNAPDWAMRFELAQDFIVRRIVEAPEGNAAVGWAYQRIDLSGGRIAIATMADEIGWSRKHLANRFRDAVGVGPKTIARVTRFNRALAHARCGSERWADIAADCGYADQAHMTREFRALAGESPAQWRANLG